MSDTRSAAWTPRPDPVHREPASVLVRPIAEPDFADATRIIHARDGGDPDRILDRLRRETTDAASDWCHILVAVIGTQVAGWARSRHFTPAPDAPADVAPAGWYLAGLIVDPPCRRRGIGHALTRDRLDRLARCTDAAYYFANAQNRVTIDLHARLGFTEMTREFSFPGVTFSGDGAGILSRVDLTAWPPPETPS